ncbi:hypothetical protein ACN6A1_24285 [Myxococcus virescens]|uniref:hypothetical protein n=1 Tax=Myxococcus virescens TaxID=83456 RepID=UPI003DA3311A
MPLWIAIAAGLGLGQLPDTPVMIPPEDPSIRDPAAAALQDANQQAAEEIEGRRPPAGYVYEAPEDASPRDFVLTPVLPDGAPPPMAGQVAAEEAAQRYEPVPSPLEALQQEQAAMGGSGQQPGDDGTSTGQDTTGGATNGAGGSGVTGQDVSGTGGQQDVRGTGTSIGNTGTGGAGTTGSQDGSGTPPENAVPAEQQNLGNTGATGAQAAPQQGTPTGQSGTGTTSAVPSPAPATPAFIGGSEPIGRSEPIGHSEPIGRSEPIGTPPTVAPVNNPMGTGGAGTQSTTQPTPTQQMEQLRERMKQLEAQLNERDADLTVRNQAVQLQVDTYGDRAVDVEQARQDRLAQIQTASQWMLAADTALEQGELDVVNALDTADNAFVDLRDSAEEDGQGTVVVHAERLRALLNLARNFVNNRDGYNARLALQEAGVQLNILRAANLERQATGNVLLNP